MTVLAFDPNKLRLIRTGRNLSQTELADHCIRCGCRTSRRLISAYERGRAEPPLSTLMVLTDELGLGDPRDLFSESSRLTEPGRSASGRPRRRQDLRDETTTK